MLIPNILDIKIPGSLRSILLQAIHQKKMNISIKFTKANFNAITLLYNLGYIKRYQLVKLKSKQYLLIQLSKVSWRTLGLFLTATN